MPVFKPPKKFVPPEKLKKIRAVYDYLSTDNPADAATDIVAPMMAAERVGAKAVKGVASESMEAFKNWFGKSKVVDEAGEPKRLFHVSPNKFNKFDASRGSGVAGQGNYFSEEPLTDYGENVYETYLNISNPLHLNGGDAAVFAKQRELLGTDMRQARTIPEIKEISKKFTEALKKEGYDGVIMDADKKGKKYYVAFEPTQIKSATGNRGTFDSKNPDITKAVAPQVAYKAMPKDKSDKVPKLPKNLSVNLSKVEKMMAEEKKKKRK